MNSEQTPSAKGQRIPQQFLKRDEIISLDSSLGNYISSLILKALFLLMSMQKT